MADQAWLERHKTNIINAYKEILGRTPSEREVEQQANNPDINSIVAGMKTSDEYYKNLVTKAYKENLYRTPDKGGLQTYINYLKSGKSYDDLVADISGSKEGLTADYRKLIRDWYSTKPATPASFEWTDEAEASAKRSVGEEYRPYYQEQQTFSDEDYKKSLQTAREGFSRRGLWGAQNATATKEVDPTTGLERTVYTPNTAMAGPQSGLRQVGEQDVQEQQTRASTAYGRAYTEAVAGGVQSRQEEAQDVYQKTIRDPYEQAYQNWQNQLALYQS